MSTLPADAWPHGDLVVWHDDSTRTVRDFLNETTRAYTAEENAEADARALALTADANGRQIRAAARDALVTNRAFLAIASPTNAQVLAQTKALTRQMNALARLVLGDLSGTD